MPLMTFEKVLRAVSLGAIFALPFAALLVTESLFFPYITGKNFAFRILVEIAAGAWLALALVNPAYRPKRSWILAALAIFVVLIGLSDALGVAPFKSFWSNFERMDGWITLAHVFVYLVVASSMLTTERLWRSFWWVSLGVSVYLSIYGLLQMAGFSALGQGGQAGLAARIDATFGNPIYLAGYMLFHIFIAAHLFLRSWQERPAGARLAPSLAYGAVIALDTLALFLSGTRGTMLGLIGGATLTLLLLALTGSKRLRTAALTAVAVIVLLGASLYAAKETALVQNVGFLQRLATISLSDSTIKARFLNMSIAWQGVKERPLIGWGQENYAVVFDKYYDPRMHGQEPWFDRVHNIVFDWLIAGGIVGLLAYLSIFLAALYALWRPSGVEGSTEASGLNVRSEVFSAFERALFTGLLAGYFVHNLTVFDNITSYILFGSVLAYIAWRSSEQSVPLFPRPIFSRSLLPVAALIGIVVTWGAAWYVNADALRANRALINAIQQQQNLDTNYQLFDEAISYHAIGTQEAREQLAQGTARLAAADIPAETKKKYLDTAVREMTAQSEESPLDARFPLFLGILYRAFGDYDNAAKALEKALSLSPRKQAIFFELGQNEFLRGQKARGVQYYKQAYELNTSVSESRLLYISALIRNSEFSAAEELLRPQIVDGSAADDRILAAYVERGRYDLIVPIWLAAIEARPTNMQYYATLAAVYYKLGERQEAIAILQKAIEVEPSVATQFSVLIEDIRKGTAKVD